MTDAAEQRKLLAETVERLFRDVVEGLSERDEDAIARGELPAPLWQVVEDNGVASVLVPEDAGGFGGGWEDAIIVLKAAAYHGVPLPIAETSLAQGLLARSGIAPPTSPIGIVAREEIDIEPRADGAWRVNGIARAVPWGNAVAHIAVIARGRLALVAAGAMEAAQCTHTVAREPVADLHFTDTPALGAGEVVEDAFALCALARVAQMAGALDAALHQSVQYANERVQFGKPIGKFQAIQHALALLASEAAAVNCAALAACRQADRGDAGFEIAAAKLRANRAVGSATSIAHQVHGAIGFTREHKLHRATQRLWSWRSEYGNDRHWASRLGAMAARAGAENFWPMLTARSDGG